MRWATLLGWLVLALGDTLIHSKTSVGFHFKRDNSYLYAAANHSISEALVGLYKSSQNLEYLTTAAKQNHNEAISLLYQTLRHKSGSPARVWQNKAIEADEPTAIFDHLVTLTDASQWQIAQDVLNQYVDVLTKLEEPELSQFKSLRKSIEFRPQQDVGTKVTAASRFDYGSAKSNSTQCVMNIALLLQDQGMLEKAEKWIAQFQTSELAVLPICWLPPKVSPELSRICVANSNALIDCAMQDLSRNFANYYDNSTTTGVDATNLMVMTDTGDANTRGGLMLISHEDQYSVFIHEFAHWFNYFDEYQVAKAQQRLLCKTKGYKRLGHNLVLAEATLSKGYLESELGLQLYPAKTCAGTDVKAYKLFSGNTFMEYLDTPISGVYAKHIIDYFDPTKLVPVAMNFALTFQYHDSVQLNPIDKEYWQNQYEYWLALAADSGFPPAMRLLSQLRRKQNADEQAKRLLFTAANLGDSTSQVLLGHIYLEGQWMDRDLKASASWYRRAALSNDPYGLYFYGKCFEMGWGCPKSPDIANNWFNKAAKLGSELAIKKLQTSN